MYKLYVYITDFTGQVEQRSFASQDCEQICKEVGLEKVI